MIRAVVPCDFRELAHRGRLCSRFAREQNPTPGPVPAFSAPRHRSGGPRELVPFGASSALHCGRSLRDGSPRATFRSRRVKRFAYGLVPMGKSYRSRSRGAARGITSMPSSSAYLRSPAWPTACLSDKAKADVQPVDSRFAESLAMYGHVSLISTGPPCGDPAGLRRPQSSLNEPHRKSTWRGTKFGTVPE